jgi:carbon storage regulator
MLVLSRKDGEEIIIGKDIKVVVLEIQGGRVRLGIDAPRSTSIFRQELLARVPSTLDPGGAQS